MPCTRVWQGSYLFSDGVVERPEHLPGAQRRETSDLICPGSGKTREGVHHSMARQASGHSGIIWFFLQRYFGEMQEKRGNFVPQIGNSRSVDCQKLTPLSRFPVRDPPKILSPPGHGYPGPIARDLPAPSQVGQACSPKDVYEFTRICGDVSPANALAWVGW